MVVSPRGVYILNCRFFTAFEREKVLYTDNILILNCSKIMNRASKEE